MLNYLLTALKKNHSICTGQIGVYPVLTQNLRTRHYPLPVTDFKTWRHCSQSYSRRSVKLLKYYQENKELDTVLVIF